MKTVNISKQELLDTLIKNRAIHLNNYLMAMKEYQKALEKKLAKMLKKLEDVKNNDELSAFSTTIGISKPVNYIDSYDVAIEMLKWSVDDTISITKEEFDNYVLDNWSWKQSFNATTMSYLALE